MIGSDLSTLPLLTLAGPAVLAVLSACAPGAGDTPGDSREAAAAGPLTQEACEAVGEVLGVVPNLEDGTCRATFPRADLEVELLGATLPPGMGLTSWAAFRSAEDRGAIVMGDLALTGDELPAVMTGLRENGIRVTAVHRHMAGESPPMSFMHYLGIGPLDSLARGLDAALSRAPSVRAGTRSEVSGPPRAASTGTDGVVAGLACDSIARILGTDPAGADTGPGYCKVSRPRSDLDVGVDGIGVPASMGIGSWFAFRETADGEEVALTGDMALLQEEVNAPLAALREHGLEVVALHNHMLFDEPRIMFFHFQARGEAAELARGLRAGLEAARLIGPS